MAWTKEKQRVYSKDYRDKPENKVRAKACQKAYSQTKKYKAAQKAHRAKPDVRARLNAMRKARGLKPENYRKEQASWKAQWALKIGNISKEILCQYCGKQEKLQMHHTDTTYQKSNDLHVQQICRSCHCREHKYLKTSTQEAQKHD